MVIVYKLIHYVEHLIVLMALVLLVIVGIKLIMVIV